MPLKVARVPAPHKDANDWLRAGASDKDFAGMLTTAEAAPHPLDTLLDARRYDPENPPAKEPAVLVLGDKEIATAGNLGAITAQAKAGKSAVLTAMMAALMEPDGDCFSFAGENPEGLAVIHFDTEQSRYDHHCVVRQINRRAKCPLPPWFRSYTLADVATKDRRAALAHEMARAAKAGRLYAVFIDGLADLCIDPNDGAEAFGLIEELHRLAIQYHCAIFCVLHENPGGAEIGKTRGHLGSQLERKAETNLRLVKDSTGVTTIFSERARHFHLSKERGVRFAWNEEAGMHCTVVRETSETTPDAGRKYRDMVAQIFARQKSLRYSELKSAIMEHRGVLPRRAEKIISELIPGNIRRTTGGNYEAVAS